LSAFKNLRKAGIRALRIDDEDQLISAHITGGDDEIIISTAKGMACRFEQAGQVRPMGRTARGVTGIRFKLADDYVVSMEVMAKSAELLDDDTAEVVENTEGEATEISQSTEPQILVVSDGGMGKRSFVATYRKTKRGAKGVTSIRLRDGETVIAALQIKLDDELMLTTEKGQLVRIPANEIRTIGRASRGVRIMNLKDGDTITSVAKIVKVEGEPELLKDDATPVDENASELTATPNSTAETVNDAMDAATVEVETAEIATEDQTTE
jgi:DNA gyrase subunit A